VRQPVVGAIGDAGRANFRFRRATRGASGRRCRRRRLIFQVEHGKLWRLASSPCVHRRRSVSPRIPQVPGLLCRRRVWLRRCCVCGGLARRSRGRCWWLLRQGRLRGGSRQQRDRMLRQPAKRHENGRVDRDGDGCNSKDDADFHSKCLTRDTKAHDSDGSVGHLFNYQSSDSKSIKAIWDECEICLFLDKGNRIALTRADCRSCAACEHIPRCEWWRRSSRPSRSPVR